MRPQRALERYERNRKGEKHPKILEQFNDKFADKERYLHPTKGWRRFSVKRSKAAMITAQIKTGEFPPAIISWRGIKKILTSGLPA